MGHKLQKFARGASPRRARHKLIRRGEKNESQMMGGRNDRIRQYIPNEYNFFVTDQPPHAILHCCVLEQILIIDEKEKKRTSARKVNFQSN